MPVLLGDIRSCPGIEDFLLPPSEAELRAAAARGPIVILNVSRHRCDALIVEQAALRVVKLPQLSPKKRLAQAPHVRSVETLDWFWTLWAFLRPLLPILGHIFGGNRLDCLPDFLFTQQEDTWNVISVPSLTEWCHHTGHPSRSSIKTIIHNRQKRNPPTPIRGSHNVVLVAMQDTPGQKSLRHASSKIIAVQGVYDQLGLPWMKPKAQRRAILSAIESCMIFHFAGHGKPPIA
ncbi:hypothetical protein NOF04DRAFT_1273697 [Fusarium oxysporum II5]|uniref:CHAT domain-containing protein n=1 Tax=Fusarium oxysporum f. sp. cubense TaxID=61366 RepID=A0A5C6TFP2_FUSOC|nr:hypothetical protein NOF04DRAFT_1273697 [Fusarium oxysporum II5]TXC09576.1 hypothetical protein FocTR4_00004502 [Fusarium oxysporum f. sp. cubense]